MSVQQDINLWEFLDTENFQSTENLKELSAVLLTGMSSRMNAYGWEYESWLDETTEGADDSEDAYFNISNQEEEQYDEYTSKI